MDSKQEQKFHELTEAPVSRLICRLALPCIISMLVTAFYNMADTFFVGMLKSPSATGAVGVVFSMMAIIQAVGFFFGHGSGNFISRELGKQNTETASNMAATGFFAALATGLLICVLGQIFLEPLALFLGSTPTILPYSMDYLGVILYGAPWMTASLVLNNQLRFQGSAAYGMVGIVSGAVINIGLDPLLIFVFDMGIAGAAWATIIGQFLSFLAAIAYIRRFKTVEVRLSDVRLNLQGTLRTAALGMSNSLNQVGITLVQIVLNNSLTYYGALSEYGTDIPLAACGIVMKTNAILLAVIIGISQGSQPIIGFNYGARQFDRVRGTYRLAITCNLVISTIGFLLFQFFPYQIISLFGTGDAMYYEFAIRFMRTFLFMVIINGVQLLSSNFFAAIGKPLKGLVLSMTRQVFFLIPLVLILPLFFGLDGILYSGPVADFIAFLVSVILIRREMRKMQA